MSSEKLIILSEKTNEKVFSILRKIHKTDKSVPPEFFFVETCLGEIDDYFLDEEDEEIDGEVMIYENKSCCFNFKDLDYERTKNDIFFNYSCIHDSRDDSSAGVTVLPPYCVFSHDCDYVEILSKYIKDNFAAIGGIMINENDYFSVILFSTYHSYDHQLDFRGLICYEINHETAKEYIYYPRTVGEYYADGGEKIPGSPKDEDKNPYARNFKSFYLENEDELSSDEDIEELIKKDPRPDKYLYDKSFCGINLFYNVPLDIQVKACAKILDISFENMYAKMILVSHHEIQNMITIA